MAIRDQKDRCRALASRERAQLITCLHTPHNVSDLLKKCTLSQSALSQHLKVLRDAEIVTATREGKHIMYSVRDKKVLKLARLLLDIVQTK